jgi:hypothetical protein
MPDLDDLVASLATDADRMLLPPPQRLRAMGDVRNRRTVAVVSTVVVAIIATLAGAGLALAGPRAVSQFPGEVTPDPVPTAPPSSTAPVVVDPTGASPTPVPSGPHCIAAQLAFVSAVSQGAMGTVSTQYVVRNVGSVSCLLTDTLWLNYIADSGATYKVPAIYSTGAPLLLPPGDNAGFVVSHPNGYPGLPSGDPRCHAATYRHVSMVLADGSALPLGSDDVISVQCGDVRVTPWGRPSGS